MEKTATGFCPTQNKDYTISLHYEPYGQDKFMLTGASCHYIENDFSKCQIYKQCPIKAEASQNKCEF